MTCIFHIVNRLKSCLHTTAFVFCFLFSQAQENVTTLGIQFKPMIPSKYFNTGTEGLESDTINISINPKAGLNFGMVVRRGLTKSWSFETGICLVQRNYSMKFDLPQLGETQHMTFRYICYEIPFQGIIFVKLTDQIYMNGSAGFSLDLYPSDIETFTSVRKDSISYDFMQKTWRKSWIQAAILANYGFEYRTKSSGYFYLGASYHRPFNEIGYTAIEVERNSNPDRYVLLLRGNYLTADFRYFFHEKPERKKPKE